MESQAEPMEIILCDDMYRLIRDDFLISEIDETEIKGFGTKTLYRLEGTNTPLTMIP